MNPNEFIITRKRKKYRFAIFANAPNCFEMEQLHAAHIVELAAGKSVTLEIGAGTALFSVELARRHPERFFIATDAKADRLQVGSIVATDEKLENIIFVRVHADQMTELIAPRTIDEIWLTFSDPFPKKRHAKHRLSHARFLSHYRTILSDNGVLLQKTDSHVLFDWSLEQYVSNQWHITELTYDLHESKLAADYKIMTTYEQRFSADGLPIYFVSARR